MYQRLIPFLVEDMPHLEIALHLYLLYTFRFGFSEKITL